MKDVYQIECPNHCGYIVRVRPKVCEFSLEQHLRICPRRLVKRHEIDDKPRVSSSKPLEPEGGHPIYLQVLEERRKLHVEKSGGYGTGSDPFANFTAVSELTGLPRWVYPMLRAEEKLQRAWSLYTQKRYAEIEEEFTDISSLFDCATAMLRSDGYPES